MINFNKALFKSSFGFSGQLPPKTAVEVCFAGRSNVGKSSLINKLFNRKSLARVSSSPGKTATVNFYECDGVTFADLPGYGYAKTAKSERRRFGELMEGYFRDRNIDLVIQLIDIRHEMSEDDKLMLTFLCDKVLPFIVVLTKADKLSKTAATARASELRDQLQFSADKPIITFSAKTGEGVSELRDAISSEIRD